MGRLPKKGDIPRELNLDIIPPPNNDPPTNILILLHGLGDSHAAFTNLGRQMNLPETVCISIQGPNPLLDLGGFHWGDDIMFDSNTGGLDPDAGFEKSTQLLKQVVQNMLIETCGYRMRDIHFFGFGQGAMAALNCAVSVFQAAADVPSCELGGVVSIGGSLPGATPASFINKCKTPILVCAGSDQSAVTGTSEDKLKRVFEFVEIKRYRRPGDSMPSNRSEMVPIMQFLARRLKSTKGVPADSVEIS